MREEALGAHPWRDWADRAASGSADASGAGTVYYMVRKVAAVSGRDLRNARPSVDQNNLPAVSFTLTPLLASRWLRAEDEHGTGILAGFGRWFNRGFARLEGRYSRLLAWSLRHRWSVVSIAFLCFVAAIAILPYIILWVGDVKSFPFAGTTVLIAVGVALELMRQIDSQLMLRNYDGFLK